MKIILAFAAIVFALIGLLVFSHRYSVISGHNGLVLYRFDAFTGKAWKTLVGEDHWTTIAEPSTAQPIKKLNYFNQAIPEPPDGFVPDWATNEVPQKMSASNFLDATNTPPWENYKSNNQPK